MKDNNGTAIKYVQAEFNASGKKTGAQEIYQSAKVPEAPIRLIVAAGAFTAATLSAAMHSIADQVDKQLGL